MELQHEEQEEQQGFLRLRVRTLHKILKSLDEHSGTGPDRRPARILKRCAAELALPVTLIARKLLAEGRWPLCWRTHWVHEIRKRKSRADAKNYKEFTVRLNCRKLWSALSVLSLSLGRNYMDCMALANSHAAKGRATKTLWQ